MYDIIGDIHGHADELAQLLLKLGYFEAGDSFAHKDRKVIFAGDFIDRGPKVRETLHIVHSMVISGNAYAVLGNHEYNLICFLTPNHNNGGYLRYHTYRNTKQHFNTLNDFREHKEEFLDFVKWIKTLPLFLEFDGIRIVHASWISRHIEYIRQTLPGNKLTDEFIERSVNKNTYESIIIDELLKGIEIQLPKEYEIKSADGDTRKTLRIKWWGDERLKTYKELAFIYSDCLPDVKVPDNVFDTIEPYNKEEKPVFGGHYWLSGNPNILSENICCLDYSIAKGGKLVAYRWDGEKKLDNSKFIYVE